MKFRSRVFRVRLRVHAPCQCILAYPNPFGSLARKFAQISETTFIMYYMQYNLKRKISLIFETMLL